MTEKSPTVYEDPIGSKGNAESTCINYQQTPSVSDILPTDTATTGNYKNIIYTYL
jgi:hypothetical protein